MIAISQQNPELVTFSKLPKLDETEHCNKKKQSYSLEKNWNYIPTAFKKLLLPVHIGVHSMRPFIPKNDFVLFFEFRIVY